MMPEISLHILDIAQNSVRAGASLIEIRIDERPQEDLLLIAIRDNGCGMTAEQAAHAADPFYTTRETRRVGLGIPFFKMAAELSGGRLTIESEPNVGTTIEARFGYSNVDRMPLGDINSTISALIQCNPQLDFLYSRTRGGNTVNLDTRELRAMLDGVSLSTPEVALFLSDYLEENTRELLHSPL